MMMPPTPDLADHLRKLRTLTEARADAELSRAKAAKKPDGLTLYQ
jgi:hypothetical protein